MMETYNHIPDNAIIMLDVANIAERSVLLDKLIYNIYNTSYDTYGVLLRILTKYPIITTSMLQDSMFMNGNGGEDTSILFTDLHIGKYIYIYSVCVMCIYNIICRFGY